MPFEFQDKYNSSKVWVIRKSDKGTPYSEEGGYEWNQKIDGILSYDRFSPVAISWVGQALGAEVARQVVEALNAESAEEEAPESADLKAGELLQVWVNQGLRDAIVLGVHEDKAIVEYEMPAGTTAMIVVPRDGSENWGKSVSYRTCPKYWVRAIRKGLNNWDGHSQTGTIYKFPNEEENSNA
jgi:hypothetical protein